MGEGSAGLSPFVAEREKLIEREDGFGYQALTEFAESFYASWPKP